MTDIVVLGRRGPAEAKWTTKELREFGELADADVVVDPDDLASCCRRAVRRSTTIRSRAATSRCSGLRGATADRQAPRVHLRFLVSPVEIEPDATGVRVGEIVLERNRLVPRGDGTLRAVGTVTTERRPASLVLRSVGYRGRGLPASRSTRDQGVVPHDRGRVLGGDGERVPGMYVAGWIKRGPSGVIGTNKPDAVETVASLLADPVRTIDPEDARLQAIDELLFHRGVEVIDREAWRRIDAAETAAGVASGRPRVKLVTLRALIDAGR